MAQQPVPEAPDYRVYKILFQGDSVQVLVRSKKNEAQKRKPLLFFCQGSLPIPLILMDKGVAFGTYPFNPEIFLNDYHIVIVGKPGIPLVCDIKNLQNDFAYRDSAGHFPATYTRHNLLSYYVQRNITVLQYLQKQPWAAHSGLLVAGHSEGSTIAAKMAMVQPAVTKLIYSGANPLGRILTMIAQARKHGTGDEVIDEWKAIVNDPQQMDTSGLDTYKATYEFSTPPIHYLEKIKIPVLVCYGTRDYSAPYNDYLQVEMIRRKRRNFTFKAYVGTEHNYFPVKENGATDYDTFNWDKVAKDWLHWLKSGNLTQPKPAPAAASPPPAP